MFNNILNKTNANQVWEESTKRTNQDPEKHPYTIEQVRDEFIKYLEATMSK